MPRKKKVPKATTLKNAAECRQFSDINVWVSNANDKRNGKIRIAGVLSGDADTPGLANNSVTNAALRDSAGTSVIGRSAGTAGDPADITATLDGQVLQRVAGTLQWAAAPSSAGGWARTFAVMGS